MSGIKTFEDKTKGKIEKVEYHYLYGAIIFLIISYYFLHNTRRNSLGNHNYDIQKKIISVKTEHGDKYMDPNIFEMHLRKLKDTISLLHTDDNYCDELQNYLGKVKVNLSEFIKINSGEINRPLDDAEPSYKISELLQDIEIILLMLKSSTCKRGSIDIGLVDVIAVSIYKNNCMKREYINKPKKNITIESRDLKSEGFCTNSKTVPHASRRAEPSQDYLGLYKDIYRQTKPSYSTIDNFDSRSHSTQDTPDNYTNPAAIRLKSANRILFNDRSHASGRTSLLL
jgi:hypothetical protein